MIQHFLEERFHKAVRFFTGIKTKDIDAIGNVKVTGSLSLNGDAVARPYKVYSALITQVSTNAPTAQVMENTLGGTPTFGYVGVGTYTITLVGAFKENKTLIFDSAGVAIDFKTFRYERINDDLVDIYSSGDGWNQNVEIRVYS